MNCPLGLANAYHILQCSGCGHRHSRADERDAGAGWHGAAGLSARARRQLPGKAALATGARRAWADAAQKVTGIKQNEIEPVSFPLSSVVTDPTTNLKIGIHYPLLGKISRTSCPVTLGSRYHAGYDKGTRNPMAQGNTGLTQTVYIVPRAVSGGDGTNQDGNPNRGTGIRGIGYQQFEDLAKNIAGGTTFVNVIQKDSNRELIIKAVMSSAIVAAPGPDTGEMLVAYPQSTAHSVEVAPEQMTMQMRAYLGAKVRSSIAAASSAFACSRLRRSTTMPTVSACRMCTARRPA